MNLIEIKDAAFNGKTFTLKNVHLESIDFRNIQTCIDNFGNPVLVKTATVKFVSPDIIDSVYNEEKDYPNIEITEQPKYDPCRLFKKGDKATPRIVNGRKPVCGIDGVAAKINSVELIVESNEGERENGTVDIKFPCGTIGQIDPVYLELVTPVEERSPYSVGESSDYFSVDKEDEELCLFWKDKHPHAQEAAEAECARLNAEHGKEQNND